MKIVRAPFLCIFSGGHLYRIIVITIRINISRYIIINSLFIKLQIFIESEFFIFLYIFIIPIDTLHSLMYICMVRLMKERVQYLLARHIEHFFSNTDSIILIRIIAHKCFRLISLNFQYYRVNPPIKTF